MSKIEWTNETKQCASCAEVKPLDNFARDRSRADGRTYWCKACRNSRAQRTHVPVAEPRRPGPDSLDERDGDARQARRTINHLVETGELPHPNTLPCSDCGHSWQPGERRHEYDHHRGYGSGHHRDVEPVCSRCHHLRERARRAA